MNVRLLIATGVVLVASTATGTGVRLALMWPGAHPASNQVPAALPGQTGGTPAAGPLLPLDITGATGDPLAAPGPAPGAPPASAEVQFKQLSRILSRMNPADAAVLLSYLGEAQCLAILRAMSVGECTAILRCMPQEQGSRLLEQLFGASKEDGR